MWGDRRLVWLVTAHVFLWLLSTVLAPVKVHAPFGLQEILLVPLFAVTFSQVSLLGIWAVFSASRAWYRLLGLVIGMACLEAALDIAMRQDFLLMPSVAMALTVASLLVVRWFGVRLFRRAANVPLPCREPEGLKFSIRGLMVLIAVVALLIAVARSMRESPGSLFFKLNVWAVCFVAVSIIALWAATGLERTLRRCVLAIVVSTVLGAFVAYAADVHGDGWIYIIMIMLLYPAILLGSLLFVRSCGYHFVRPSVSRLSPLEFTFNEPGNSDREVPTSTSATGDRP